MATTTVHAHAGPSSRLFVTVWLSLLAITAVEIVLAYMHLFSTPVMLAILMLLSLVKAGLIVAYFMHLRFEKASLVLALVPVVVLVIALLFVFFPDGIRLHELRVR